MALAYPKWNLSRQEIFLEKREIKCELLKLCLHKKAEWIIWSFPYGDSIYAVRLMVPSTLHLQSHFRFPVPVETFTSLKARRQQLSALLKISTHSFETHHPKSFFFFRYHGYLIDYTRIHVWKWLNRPRKRFKQVKNLGPTTLNNFNIRSWFINIS